MQSLATQVWNPWIALLVILAGAALLLVTVLVPLRGLPRMVSALRGGAVREPDGGLPWLPLAASCGMGGITGGVLAIEIGGPGALVWMWIATLLGMAIVFGEGSLAARRPSETEPASVHLLAVPLIGRILAPMYALAAVVVAVVFGAAFQTHQAAAVVESVTGYPPQTTASVLAVVSVPFVFLPQLRRLVLLLVPAVLLVYGVAVISAVGDLSMLGLKIGDAFNVAFGQSELTGGAIGGGVWVAISQGMLRATMAGGAGLGSAALADLRARSRGSVGALVMMVPLLTSGIVGSLTALLLLGSPAEPVVIDPEVEDYERYVPLELQLRRRSKPGDPNAIPSTLPSMQVGQTVVLPLDTTMEAGKHYEMRMRSNPRGHALARLNEEENKVQMPHWAIAQHTDTVVFRSRDPERSKYAAWDVRIPCHREIVEVPGVEETGLSLTPVDSTIDMRKLTRQLGLNPQPFVVLDDFQFTGSVGRATSPKIGEYLAMYEQGDAVDRPFNPAFHQFFRNGFRGPYAEGDGTRPPWAIVAREGYTPEIGSVVKLRFEGDPRGDAVVALTHSGSVEAPAWDFLLDTTTLVVRHQTDPRKDIRLAVTPRYELHRVRFHLADARFEDMRVLAKMEDFENTPYLMLPDYTFEAEVHGDARLVPELEGRRTLIPLHPLSEVQGHFGEGDTYHPHPAELMAMGVRGPVLAHEGAQVAMAKMSGTLGDNGRLAVVLASVIFALTTLVAWAELGARAATALAGGPGAWVLRATMIIAGAVATTWSLAQLLPLVDLCLAAAVGPSLLGLLLLLPRVHDAGRMRDDLADAPAKEAPSPEPAAKEAEDEGASSESGAPEPAEREVSPVSPGSDDEDASDDDESSV